MLVVHFSVQFVPSSGDVMVLVTHKYIYIGMVSRNMVIIFVMKVEVPTRDFVYVPVPIVYILSVPVIWCMGSVSEGTLNMAIFIQWPVKQVYCYTCFCGIVVCPTLGYMYKWDQC